MTKQTATLPTMTCPRSSCGHTWTLRVASPFRCPECGGKLREPGVVSPARKENP